MIVRNNCNLLFTLGSKEYQATVVKRRGLLAQVEYSQAEGIKASVWVPDAELKPKAGRRRPLAVADKAGTATALVMSNEPYMFTALSIVVVGASGDLAKKKTFPVRS